MKSYFPFPISLTVHVKLSLPPAVLQVCTTLGMLTPEQAKQLREAGLTAYNHNLDTSPEYYSKITSSRKYKVTCHSWPHQVLCLMMAAHSQKLLSVVPGHQVK